MATKYNIRLVLMFSFIFIMLNTCKKADKNDVIIQGIVSEQASGDPINSAIVQITTPQEYSNIFNRTDSTGQYSLSGIDISNVTDVTITASAPNYTDITRSLKVSPGQNVTGFNFSLSQDGDDEEEPGDGVSGPSSEAASIHLLEISNKTIHISGSGGIINSVLTFEVQDSAGRPIDLNNAVDVEFSIISGPGGGEGISPAIVRSNAKGQVTSNLYSGTLPGVVQIQAKIEIEDASKIFFAKRKPEEIAIEPNTVADELNSENELNGRGIKRDNIVGTIDSGFKSFSTTANNATIRTITSEPVAITIHGGFPDEEYFSLSAQVHNFEGYSYDNLRVPITAILADEFSNPVVPGTAVHFSTTGGHIQGSGEGHTDVDGIATVELISGDPRPNDNIQGSGGRPGYATITAKSVDKNNESISKSIYMLFTTAQAVINAAPLNVQLETGKSQRFDYTVTDLNGNPMAPGTTIEITADDGVKLSGLTSRTLNDNLFPGQGTTDFSFTATAEEGLTGISNITIKVTSPSGTETTFEEIAIYDSQTEIEDEVTGPPTGPASLLLVNVANETINIAESGGTSSTTFTFEVRDSTGKNLTVANAANIEFSIISGPNGGENIIPEIVTTNSEGRATANLNAGNTAGVVQIQAQIQGTTIKSTPVAVTIHGGFPDQAHFDLLASQTNYEYVNNIKVPVTARLGDQFSNPVKPGTAVYFSTNKGIIEGSAQGHTNAEGEASVVLVTNGPGMACVTARTVDASNTEISTCLDILFTTSAAAIDVGALTHIHLNKGDFQDVEFSVSDLNNHPMAPGTRIEVNASHTGLALSGNTSATIPDTQSPGAGITDFEFNVLAGEDFEGNANITIIVTSPSGEQTMRIISVSGVGGVVPGNPTSPATLQLVALNESTIHIAETGGITGTTFTFQVQDSAGRNLDSRSPVDIEFSILSNPGGAYIIPEVVTTDAQGRATANLNAGNTAGVVQIQAQIQGTTIKSTPVAVTIHGGFPDQAHFTLEPLTHNNIEGFDRNGVEITYKVRVGDKFSNPVKPGTAVYFSTNGGVIEGSGVGHTDETGYTEVTLFAGNPRPANGLGEVTATTTGENGVPVTDTSPFIFSTSKADITIKNGLPYLEMSPDEIQNIGYSVTDENGNPMAPGTQIQVTGGGGLILTGNTSHTMSNELTPGNGITDFNFTVSTPQNFKGTEPITITVTSPSGAVTQNQELKVVATGGGVAGPPAGAAALILESVQRETINIAQTGGIISSAFTFQVQDSSGRPLNADNPVEVEFEIVQGPTGANIMPGKVTTNSTGRVTASLMAGNEAGVVMIQAKVTRNDLTPVLEIYSKPVAITIHGGFPDQNHFTIAHHPVQGSINFPGYNTFGIENVLYALVGDEFSNPVKPGTAVWFSTDGGVIQGSGFGHTDELGRIEIVLLSGNPRPAGGIATVTAHTINKLGQEISTSMQVVFSTKTANISFAPNAVDLQPDGTQVFTYSVTDENGNPMPPGTTIKVIVPERMEIMGDFDVTIGDHLATGDGITDFGFVIRDTDDQNNNPEDTIIQIVVTAPDGTVTIKRIEGTRRKIIE